MSDQHPENESRGSPAPDEPVPASALRRLIAFVVDLILVVILQRATGSGRWGFVAIFALYHTVSVAVFRRTLGKAATALKVQQADGARLGAVPALLRSTLGYLASSFILLGFLHSFRDARRRCWHDVLFGSEVVQQPGTLSVKQLIRAVDEWAEQIDAWQKRVLARYNRLRGLWQFVLKLTGLLTVVHRGVEIAWRWIRDRIRPGAAAPASQAATGAAATTVGASAVATATSAVTALALAGASVALVQVTAPPALRPWGAAGAASTVLGGECRGTITPSVTEGYIGDRVEYAIRIKPPFDTIITRVSTNNPLCRECDAAHTGPGRFVWRTSFAGKGPFKVEFVAYDKDGKVRCNGYTTEMAALGPKPR